MAQLIHLTDERLARHIAKTGIKPSLVGLGLQIIIPRKIRPDEIMRIYVPTQRVGWRY